MPQQRRRGAKATSRRLGGARRSVTARRAPTVGPTASRRTEHKQDKREPSSRRVTSSATVSRAPPSPPPTFVTPVGPAPPTTTVRTGSVSCAPPRLLLPLFSPMTPTSRLASPPRTLVATGPPSPTRPASQSTPRLPAPTDGNPDLLSPPPSFVSPRPSTVGPSSWASYRPRLLVGLSAGSRTLKFL